MNVPEALAQRLAAIPVLGVALDIVEVALESGRPLERVASVFFELGEALDIDGLRHQIEGLPVESRWHAQARGSLRDELATQHRALATQILSSASDSNEHPVAQWLGHVDPAREADPRHAGGNPLADGGLSDRIGRVASFRAAGAGCREGGLTTAAQA